MRFSSSLPLVCLFLSSVTAFAAPDVSARRSATSIIVSVPDQKMVVLQNGLKVGSYPVSTSKFGLGDRPRSYATPLGKLMVAQKVGANAPEGAVFKGRRPTGEVLKPNAKGRDPIVTRILYLRGMEPQNASAFDRAIYIHGTPEERRIGRPASYGCVRMKSRDVVKVFDAAPVGTTVQIVNQPLGRVMREIAAQRHTSQPAS
jgi:lipoprotein-anchoring transpeptidase ErfK/SrfK